MGAIGCMAFVIAHHLNDTHRWTREQIADWVQTVEIEAPPPEQLTPAAQEVESSVSQMWPTSENVLV